MCDVRNAERSHFVFMFGVNLGVHTRGGFTVSFKL